MKVYRIVRFNNKKNFQLGEGNNLLYGYLTPREDEKIDNFCVNTFDRKKSLNGKFFYLNFEDAVKLLSCRQYNYPRDTYDVICEINIPIKILKQYIGLGVYDPRLESKHMITGKNYFAMEFMIPYSVLYDLLGDSNMSYQECINNYINLTKKEKRLKFYEFSKYGLRILCKEKFYECVSLKNSISFYDKNSYEYTSVLQKIIYNNFEGIDEQTLCDLKMIMGFDFAYNNGFYFTKKANENFNQEAVWDVVKSKFNIEDEASKKYIKRAKIY